MQLIKRIIPGVFLISKMFSMSILMKFEESDFPRMPIGLISRKQWDTTLDKYLFPKLFPVVDMPIGKGTVYIDDVHFDQLNIKPTRSWDVAPLVNMGETPVNYDVQEIRRRYFIDPTKLYNMPGFVRQSEYSKGSMATTRNIMIAFEYFAYKTLFNPANWDTDSPLVGWDDPINSTPLSDLQAAAFDVSLEGMVTDIVFDPLAWAYFWASKEVRDTYPNVIFKTATMSNLLAVLTGGNLNGLQRVHIGSTVYTTSNEGQTATPATRVRMWTNGVWLGQIDQLAMGETSESATLGVKVTGQPDMPSVRTYKEPSLHPDSEFVESLLGRGFIALNRRLAKFLNGIY